MKKNYGTMEKIWYYGKNYLTIPKTMDLGFTKGKNGGLPKTMKL